MTTLRGEDNQTTNAVPAIAESVLANYNPQYLATVGQTNTIQNLPILETSPIYVLHWSLPKINQIRFSYVSDNISQLGYNAEDIVAGNVQWLELIHPDDKPNVIKTIADAIFAKETHYTHQYRFKKSSGDYRWIENRANIVRADDGSIQYFQGLLIDITDRKMVEAELHQKSTYLEMLHEITLGLMHRSDLRTLFDSLVKRLYDLIDVKYVYLSLVNNDKLQMVAAEGIEISTRGTVSYGEGASGKVWQSKEALYIEDYFSWEGCISDTVFEKVKSVAGLPLFADQKIIGVIGIVTQKTTEFDIATRKVLENFAQIGSVALDNALLFNNAQRELQERQKLEKSLACERNALAKQIQFRTDLASLVADSLAGNLKGDFYQTILERAISIVHGAEAGSLLVKGSSKNFYFKAAVGYNLTILETIGLKEDEIFRDLRSSEPIRVYGNDSEKLSKEKVQELSAASDQDFQVALTIPIHLYGEPVALFSLDNFHNSDAFDDDTVYLAKIFANQVTALWQRLMLEKSFKKNQNNYRHLFLEASQYSKELQILDKLRSVIVSKLELRELLDNVCTSMVDIFAYGRVCIGLIQEDSVVVIASHGTDETMVIPNKAPLSTKTFQTIINSGEAYFIPQDSPIFQKDSHKKTMMVLPLVSGNEIQSKIKGRAQGEIYGFIAVGCESRKIDAKEQTLIEKVVEQLQIAIDNAKLHEQVKKDLVRVNTHYKISKAIQQNNNAAHFMDNIIEAIRTSIGARWASMYRMDFAKGSIEHVSKSQAGETVLPSLSFEELNSGLTGWAIKRQEIAHSPDITKDDREIPQVRKKSLDLDIGGAVVIPLIYKKEVFGTLGILNHRNDAEFTTEDIKLLQVLADQTGAALAECELRQAIEYQAFHDSLTGLPNRIYIENRLNIIIEESRQQKSSFATLFLDLDGFKHVNDTLGHNIGDELLKAVAGRLNSNTAKGNTLARMGGDEFAVIISSIEQDKKISILDVAKSYLNLLQVPFQIGTHTIKIGASIGVSLYPDDGKDINTLLKHADSAMYQAKYSGKNSVCLFTPEIAAKLKDRMEIENDLRQVIEEGGLELFYQPQICLQSNKRVGVEALLRWSHPTKGFISPADFIPVSEESKLILDIGKWVIQEACRQNAVWQAEGFEPMTMAVNISALQFESEDFMQTVVAALEQSKLDPSYLELEVTESVIMQDVDIVIDRLNALRSIGVKVSIDDFGTGYSSLQYLQQLPLDKLKIDRTFVNALSADNKTPIIAGIFILAQSLGLATVAEGVETKEQLDFVRMLGCNEVQGYYFSKAVPASKIWESTTSLKNPTVDEMVASKEKIESDKTDSKTIVKKAA